MIAGDNLGTSGATEVEIEGREGVLELEPSAAALAGVRLIRLTADWALDLNHPRPTLNLIRFLREAAAYNIAVAWRLLPGADVDLGSLVHLPAPEATAGGVDQGADAWRDAYRPGLCYYRMGPDFVTIRDSRVPGAASRFRLAGTGMTDAVNALSNVVEIDALDATTLDVLRGLEGERLALQIGGLATLLPHRMRRWPVPALEV